jgi:hypothetical protein
VSEALERIERDATASALYERLLAFVTDLGEFEVEAKKTSIHVTHGRAFVGVHPRRGGLLVNIVTDAALPPERLHRQEQVSARRWHNEVLLTELGAFDAQVEGWIARAYALTP